MATWEPEGARTEMAEELGTERRGLTTLADGDLDVGVAMLMLILLIALNN